MVPGSRPLLHGENPVPHETAEKGLARPRNKDLRQEFDREIRTYVDDRDFFSGLPMG